MNEIFKGLYDSEMEKDMMSVNMIVFNGTTIYRHAKVLNIDEFIYVKTESGAKLMYNKSELTMVI